MKRLLILAVASFGLLGSAAPAQAAFLIGNLTGNDGQLNNIGQGLTASVGFTVGATPYTLDNAQLRLRLSAPASNAPQLRLTSDLAGTTTLVTFNTPALSIGDTTVTFTPNSPFTLAAGATYYLTLGSETGNGAFFNWLGNNPPAIPIGPGATYTTFRPSQQGFAGPLSFAVNGTAAATAVAPLPPTLAMLGLGLPAGLAVLRRRAS